MRLILTAAVAVLAAATPAAAVTFDAFTSFNGTQGEGNFSYGTINPADFTEAPLFNTSCSITGLCLTVSNPVSLTPFALKSLTAATFGTVIIPDDRLVLHPGQTANLAAIVTFLVPTTGSYLVDTLFSVQDTAPTGVGISEFYDPFGNGLGDATLTSITSLSAGTPAFSNSAVRFLNAGDVIGYVVDRQGNFSNDSTGVGFTLVAGVPEPASWALLIAGFGMAGAALRRRRPAAASLA